MKSVIDYAPYELEAKKLMKEVNELLRKNDFRTAITKIDDIVVEMRMMKAAVNSHIKD